MGETIEEMASGTCQGIVVSTSECLINNERGYKINLGSLKENNQEPKEHLVCEKSYQKAIVGQKVILFYNNQGENYDLVFLDEMVKRSLNLFEQGQRKELGRLNNNRELKAA